MTDQQHDVLDLTTALRLTQILHASMHRTPVARMVVSNLPVDDDFDYEGTLFYGTANIVVAETTIDHPPVSNAVDVRDCYLKVLLDNEHNGLVAYWPIAELIGEISEGKFIPNYLPEEG